MGRLQDRANRRANGPHPSQPGPTAQECRMKDSRAESPFQLVTAHKAHPLAPEGTFRGQDSLPMKQIVPLGNQSQGTRSLKGPDAPAAQPTVHRPHDEGPPNLPLATGGPES